MPKRTRRGTSAGKNKPQPTPNSPTPAPSSVNYTSYDNSLFPPPPVSSHCPRPITLATRKSTPALDPKRSPPASIDWDALQWDFAEILRQSSMNLPSTLNNHHQQHHHMQQRTGHVLQSSKSSGNILHQLHQSKSTGNVLHHSTVQGPRVHFQLEPTHRMPPSEPPPSQPQVLQMETVPKSPLKSLSVSEMKTVLADSSGNKSSVVADSSVGKLLRLPSSVLPGGLKRSKSLGAADMMRQNPSSYSVSKEAPDLGPFPSEVHAAIRHAVEDPNKLSARTLMELVRQIMDRVVSSVSYSLPAAKLCITIIEKEHKETFLESLLNTCRQWCQERDKILKQGGGTTRFCAFMQFLNEMYCETDSLFFVLTSVGRDFEQELPNKLTQLIASVRDTFLMVHNVPSIKKTLLQLIELRAARWQLSASAVMYYTTQQ
uniref:MIF4G domain-containing protein n=1 Tax=Timema poppense TaxID=170557 RepID=A0A7R9D3K8_TIMPO|nr:unnamed protein product [Timema poppensis]